MIRRVVTGPGREAGRKKIAVGARVSEHQKACYEALAREQAGGNVAALIRQLLNEAYLKAVENGKIQAVKVENECQLEWIWEGAGRLDSQGRAV